MDPIHFLQRKFTEKFPDSLSTFFAKYTFDIHAHKVPLHLHYMCAKTTDFPHAEFASKPMEFTMHDRHRLATVTSTEARSEICQRWAKCKASKPR